MAKTENLLKRMSELEAETGVKRTIFCCTCKTVNCISGYLLECAVFQYTFRENYS